MFVGAAAGSFVLLRLVALGIMALARRLPRPRRTAPRLALANIHRPGALTPSLVLSLGLGITLLVTLALIDTNLTRQLTQTLPEQAPSFFFLDIPNAAGRCLRGLPEAAGARRPDRARADDARAPRDAAAACPSAEIKAHEEVSWVLEGDRGITYASDAAGGLEHRRGRVVAGRIIAASRWSPSTAKIAEGLGLKIGDEITVNVLGRNITATIANLREVEWRSHRHQLRHGVLAQHLRGRAAHASGHRHLPERLGCRRSMPGSCAAPPRPIPWSRACG